MTIERNRPWGERGGLTADGVIAHTDRELRGVVEQARRAGTAPPVVGLLGGDLCRTLGGRGDASRLRSPDAMRFPIDVVAVELDGARHWFVAHLIARRSWWRGRLLAVMNAEFLGRGMWRHGRIRTTAPSMCSTATGPRRSLEGRPVPDGCARAASEHLATRTTVRATLARAVVDGEAIGAVVHSATVEPDSLVVWCERRSHKIAPNGCWVLDESPGSYRWGTVGDPIPGRDEVQIRAVASAQPDGPVGHQGHAGRRCLTCPVATWPASSMRWVTRSPTWRSATRW